MSRSNREREVRPSIGPQAISELRPASLEQIFDLDRNFFDTIGHSENQPMIFPLLVRIRSRIFIPQTHIARRGELVAFTVVEGQNTV